MRKYLSSIILFLVLGIGALLFYMNQKETETPEVKLIQHFREADIINPAKGPEFQSESFDAKYQVIAYSESVKGMSIITFDWKQYFENNPEIVFIFYYSGKDKQELVNWMEETNFQHPVLYDPEKIFYKNNVIGDTKSIVFNTKDGIKHSLENPSFPNYQDSLDELVGKGKD
ncbi:hypothetical protein ACPUEN_20075 [Algoriphagus yeomjeoni]|uniref:hypothetical protein n=1 Tax=Algoriphagus yeomjeoni TaxID=291403 RepID=UPI003CE44B2D